MPTNRRIAWFCCLVLLLIPRWGWAQTDNTPEVQELSNSTQAVEHAAATVEKKINVKEIVFEHLGDAYEWHITQIGDRHISLPLPIILYSKNSGWSTFSSSHLSHGHSYKGFHIAHEGKYKGKIVEHNNAIDSGIESAGEEVRPMLDISITKNVLSLLINCTLLVLLILGTSRWYKRRPQQVPKGFPGMVEVTVATLIDDLIKPCIGKDYQRFTPYLLTVFFFILINNLMGIIPLFPGGANLTGNIAITLILSLFTFFIVNFNGSKEYWKEIFWPDVPLWLKIPLPVMPAIELFGIFTKPFALMIRLFANIMAGHSIILGLTCVIFMTASMGAATNASMSVVSIVFVIFMNFVELLVAFIQAYVFTMLSAVFIGLARVEPHHQVDKF